MPAAVDAIRAGATDFLGRPIAPERLIEALAAAADRRRPPGELTPLAEPEGLNPTTAAQVRAYVVHALVGAYHAVVTPLAPTQLLVTKSHDGRDWVVTVPPFQTATSVSYRFGPTGLVTTRGRTRVPVAAGLVREVDGLFHALGSDPAGDDVELPAAVALPDQP